MMIYENICTKFQKFLNNSWFFFYKIVSFCYKTIDQGSKMSSSVSSSSPLWEVV